MSSQDWKLAIGFMADLFYLKGSLNILELEAINDIESPEDMVKFIDKVMEGAYEPRSK